MEFQSLIVIPSALRHGFDEEHIKHAVHNAISFTPVDEGMTMIVGAADATGLLIEVGVVTNEDGVPVAVHAMEARNRYL